MNLFQQNNENIQVQIKLTKLYANMEMLFHKLIHYKVLLPNHMKNVSFDDIILDYWLKVN